MRNLFFGLLLLFALLTQGSASAVTDRFLVTAPTGVTATTGGVQALAENYYRVYLLLVNTGSTTVYVGVGGVPGASGTPIVAGGNWEPVKAPVGSIWVKAASSSDWVSIVEGIGQ